MTVDRQLEELRKMARRQVPKWLTWVLAVLAVALVGFGVLQRELIYLLGGLFAAIASYSSHQNAPHVYAAAQALETGSATDRSVDIKVECWSDSESYSVVVAMANLSSWSFDFVAIGWKPKEGGYRAKVYALSDVPWPVLICFDDGIAYPRAQPVLNASR